MISVIVPSYRSPDYLDLCLKSLVDNRDSESTQIIVIIDGFVDESKSVIEKYKGINVLPLETNHGMQYAINIGVMQAANEYVVVVNDDNVFPTHYDTRIIEDISRCKINYGDNFMLTINQVEPIGPGMFNHVVKDFGRTAKEFQYSEWLKNEPDFSSDTMNEHGHIFPFVMSKKYYLAIGGLDTFYESPNACDWDLSLKLELFGFKFPRTYNIHLYHFGSIATKNGPEGELFRQKESHALQMYTYKWGCLPYNDYPTNSKIPPDNKFRGFVT